jgi:hypothetical protein
MLNGQKCSSDKSGFGFDKFVASSLHDASISRIVFVKLEISEPHVACLDKGKNIIVHELLKLNMKYLLKSNPNSFLLAFSMVSLVILDQTVFRFTLKDLGLRSMILNKVKLVKNLPCLNMLQKKKKSYEHKHDSSYSRKSYEWLFNMMRDVLTRHDKLDKGHNIAPRVKKAWVTKVDTIHPLRVSDNGLS